MQTEPNSVLKKSGNRVFVVNVTEDEAKKAFGKKFKFMQSNWAHYLYGNHTSREFRIYYVHDVDDNSFNQIQEALLPAKGDSVWIYRS